MSMAGEGAWRELAETWRMAPAVGDPGTQIRRIADRQTMVLRLVFVGEVVVTLLTLAVVWWVLVLERGAATIGWAVAAVLHTGIVWTFTLWNRAGIWRPLGETTIDYLRLARERLRRQRRSARFTLWLVGIEVAALVAWLGIESGSDRAPRSAGIWFPAAVVTATAIGWAWWFHGRATAELDRLAMLESQVALEGGGG